MYGLNFSVINFIQLQIHLQITKKYAAQKTSSNRRPSDRTTLIINQKV